MLDQSNLRGYFEHHRSFRFLAGNDGRSWMRLFLVLASWIVFLVMICGLTGTLFLDSPIEGSPLLGDTMMGFLLVLLPSLVLLIRPLVTRFEELLLQLPSFVEKRPPPETQDVQTAATRHWYRKRRRRKDDRRKLLPVFATNAPLEDDIRVMRDYVSLRSAAARRAHSMLIVFAAVLMVVWQIVLPLVRPGEDPSWSLLPHDHLIPFLAAVMWSGFWMIFIIRSVAWYLLSICVVIFPRLSLYSRTRRIRVRPVAPDGKGGLAAIGRLALALTLFASSGLLFGIPWAVIMGASLSTNIGFPAYITFLTAIFFLPLWSVHGAMRLAKRLELDKWSLRFQWAHNRMEQHGKEGSLVPDITCEEQTHLLQDLQCMESIERLYARAEAMPIWPFDLGTLWKFCSVVVIPLGLFIYQLVSQA